MFLQKLFTSIAHGFRSARPHSKNEWIATSRRLQELQDLTKQDDTRFTDVRAETILDSVSRTSEKNK